jgi:hypothetical protein
MSTAHHTTVELSMALDRLVPAMAHGLTILTPAGGQITLPPGRLADRLADELSQGIRLELMRREVAGLEAAQP